MEVAVLPDTERIADIRDDVPPSLGRDGAFRPQRRLDRVGIDRMLAHREKRDELSLAFGQPTGRAHYFNITEDAHFDLHITLRLADDCARLSVSRIVTPLTHWGERFIDVLEGLVEELHDGTGLLGLNPLHVELSLEASDSETRNINRALVDVQDPRRVGQRPNDEHTDPVARRLRQLLDPIALSRVCRRLVEDEKQRRPRISAAARDPCFERRRVAAIVERVIHRADLL